MRADPVRAVFFDAVGTLIHPEPDAATVYAAIGKRFGSRLGIESIRPAFAAAFARQDRLDREKRWRTDEAREVARWRGIVGEVLSDVLDAESCFAVLYEHFAQPQNWRCDFAAAKVLTELTRRGHLTGIGSNFDGRLRRVLRGFPELAGQPLVISSEVGWRKPAAGFFEALSRVAQSALGSILYLGDDPINDYEGARNAGCKALLFSHPGLLELAQVLNAF
jgi:putative hydrolase of the HAD superfamily